MTGLEMLAEFQKLVTISDPRLLESERLESSEIYQLLNLAQKMVFKNRYFPSNNYAENILIINNNAEDLKKLIVSGYEVSVTLSTNIRYTYEVDISGEVDTSGITDYAHYIKSESKLVRTVVFPTSPSGELVPNQLIGFIDVRRFITNSMNSPIIRSPGVLLETGDMIRIFVDKYTTDLSSLYLTYLRYPNPIVQDEECELERSLHSVVVTTAIELFRNNKYLLMGIGQKQEQPNK